MRRWQSGQLQWTVNPSPDGLRGFKSLPAHNDSRGDILCLRVKHLSDNGYPLTTIYENYIHAPKRDEVERDLDVLARCII